MKDATCQSTKLFDVYSKRVHVKTGEDLHESNEHKVNATPMCHKHACTFLNAHRPFYFNNQFRIVYFLKEAHNKSL